MAITAFIPQPIVLIIHARNRLFSQQMNHPFVVLPRQPFHPVAWNAIPKIPIVEMDRINKNSFFQKGVAAVVEPITVRMNGKL